MCEDVVIPPHLRVGFSKEEDRKLGIVIDHDSGIFESYRGDLNSSANNIAQGARDAHPWLFHSRLQKDDFKRIKYTNKTKEVLL